MLDFMLLSAPVLIIAAAATAMRWCFRRTWHGLAVRRAMRGFDRKLQEILFPQPGWHENGHAAPYNDMDSP